MDSVLINQADNVRTELRFGHPAGVGELESGLGSGMAENKKSLA